MKFRGEEFSTGIDNLADLLTWATPRGQLPKRRHGNLVNQNRRWHPSDKRRVSQWANSEMSSL
jgi:hypothetical protein